MESRWEISFEDVVYLPIRAGLICLIITWILSVFPISTKSNNYELLNTTSNSVRTESIPSINNESHSPPNVSQQFTSPLNIHPLKVLRIHRKSNNSSSSPQSHCTTGDCKNDRGTEMVADGFIYAGLGETLELYEEGTIKWSNSPVSTRDIIDNRRSGFGRYSQADGYFYLGNWKGGMKDGIGMEKFSNGESRWGYWVKNKFIGSYYDYIKYTVD